MKTQTLTRVITIDAPTVLTSIIEKHETPNLFKIIAHSESRIEQLHRKLQNYPAYHRYMKGQPKCMCGNRDGWACRPVSLAGPKGKLPA